MIRLEGLTDYNDVWDLQRQVHAEVIAGAEDALILTEHQPVVTVGRTGGDDHFLTAPELLERMGYKIVYSNRGGDITYHGPGQLVCYPIFDLNRHYRDVHRFLRDLEEVAIRVLAGYGIQGWRVEGRTGVWTQRGKIAAVGVHIKKWVTMHGIAFNVTRQSLEGFGHIVPCGIVDGGVARLEQWYPEANIERVGNEFIEQFEMVFDRNLHTLEAS